MGNIQSVFNALDYIGEEAFITSEPEEIRKADRIILAIKAEEDLVEMLSKHQYAIKEKVGAERIKISTGKPARKLKHSSKEKIRGNEFEIHLDSF
jgi:imidazoleglycerol phosphate synthase glutamine amidotransferase subunit HisH